MMLTTALERSSGAVVVLIVVTCLIHSPALNNGYCRDDLPIVVNNPLIAEATTWSDLVPPFRHDYWYTIELGLYRPLTIASFVANKLIWGLDPFSFHAVNVALHVLATLLVYSLLLKLSHASLTALWGAAIFSVHPVQSEVVGTVVGRTDLLATLAALLVMLLTVRTNRLWTQTIAISVLVFTGMLAKESIAGLPLIVLMLGLGPRLPAASKKFRWLRVLAPTLASCFGIALYFIVKYYALGHLGPNPAARILFLDNPLGALGFSQRLPGVANAWGTAIIRSVWPLRQCGDYSFNQLESDGLALVGWLAIILIVALGAWGISRGLKNLRSLRGLLIAAALYLPVSNLLFPIGALFADRFLYLPLVGAAILLSDGLAALNQSFRLKTLIQPVIWVLLGLCSVLTWQRHPMWRDNEKLFKTLLTEAPDSAKTWYNWGVLLAAEGKREEAERAYLRSILLYPDYKDALYNLAALAMERGETASALDLITRASATDVADAEVFNLRGLIERQMGRTQEAEKSFAATLKLRPQHQGALVNLGLIKVESGAYPEAVHLLGQVDLTQYPSPIIRFALGKAYRALGNSKQALETYEELLDTVPDFAPAWLEYCQLSVEMKGERAGIACYQQALRAHISNPQIHYFLGELHRQVGDGQALAEYEAYLRSAAEHDEYRPRVVGIVEVLKSLKAAK